MPTESLLIKLKALRVAVDACIVEADPPPEWRPREYAVDEMLKGGETRQILFGKENIVPESVVLGLSETADKSFGMEYPFFFESMVVSAEDAPYLDIEVVFVGALSMWGFQYGKAVPALKFVEGNAVRFNKDATQGIIISVGVRNNDKIERRFCAKIIGREQVPVVDEREPA